MVKLSWPEASEASLALVPAAEQRTHTPGMQALREAPWFKSLLCVKLSKSRSPKDSACGPRQRRAVPIARMLLTKDGLAPSSKAIIFI